MQCEKQQVAALGRVPRRPPADLPAPADGPLPTVLELIDPVEPVWIVGPLGVAYETTDDRIVVLVEELDQTATDDDDDDDEDGGDPEDFLASLDRGSLRFELTRGQALAFAAHAAELVASGRPPCRFCGLPDRPGRPPVPADELNDPLAAVSADRSALTLLACGEVEVEGRMPWSSNATFLVDDHLGCRGVPRRSTSPAGASGRCGTSPHGLYQREVAAYELSRGARLGPRAAHDRARRARWARARSSCSSTPTSSSTTSRSTRTGRTSTPSCRPCACSTSWPTTPTARAATACSARTTASGASTTGCASHQEFKLRTVIWEFGGEPIPAELLADVERDRPMRCPLEVAALLDDDEIEALQHRARIRARAIRRFPVDTTGRRYPWPLV